MGDFVFPRDIEEFEIRHFRQRGWVFLESLISRADADLLLHRVKDHMGEDAEVGRHPVEDSTDAKEARAVSFVPLSVDHQSGDVWDETFFKFSHSTQMGSVLTQLRGKAVRYWLDEAYVKRPTHAAGGKGTEATKWHQDVGSEATSPFLPIGGQMTIWLALDMIPPEKGSMRFVGERDANGAAREIIDSWDQEEPYELFLNRSYEQLEELGVISPRFSLQPGDATVHDSGTFHSAPSNSTDSARWTYILSTFPAEARYSGNSLWAVEGVGGLKAGEQFVDNRYRLISA